MPHWRHAEFPFEFAESSAIARADVDKTPARTSHSAATFEECTMSNLNLRRVSVDLEITANKVKGVSAALSYLHESAVDRGDDIAPLLLLLSNSAFDAANELEAYFFKIISGATSAIG